MSLFSMLFEPGNVKTHRKAAEGAIKLRQIALTNASIELSMLLSSYNKAQENHEKAYQTGNFELAGRYVDAFPVAKELFERIDRMGLRLEMDLSEYARQKPTSASEWEKRTSFELNVRTVFIEVTRETKNSLDVLGRLNIDSAHLSKEKLV